MMFLVLASAFLLTVYGQNPDPTKVCLPDVLQLNVQSLYTNASGVFAYNFPAKTIAVRLSNGIHSVYNLTENTVTDVTSIKGVPCTKYSTSILDTYHFGILSQCFPAGAKLLTPANTHLGLSPASLDIEAWELDIGFGASARVAVTKSSPAVPVIIQSVFNPPGTATAGTSPASLDIEAWDLDAGFGGFARMAVTKSSPAVPVIVQSVVNSTVTVTETGHVSPDVQLLVNAKASIDDSSIFEIPDDCKDLSS